MKNTRLPLTFDDIRAAHAARRDEIRARLGAFRNIWENGNNERLWEEMVYCFFTGGCSARMGLRSIDAVRPLLRNGSREELAAALVGVHRFPNERSRYISASREFLTEHCGMNLRKKLEGFDDLGRRDWLVSEKRIKGLGYKEASHFLRNIGFTGYAILDKHVLRSMAELRLIADPKPPNSRLKYLTVETVLKETAEEIGIDFDELDLVLWSMRTGEILK